SAGAGRDREAGIHRDPGRGGRLGGGAVGHRPLRAGLPGRLESLPVPEVRRMNAYDLARGLHILAVIAWVAGLLYLPRLYAYHVKATPGGESDLTFQTMERKLLKIIMNPAMIVA